MSDPTPIPLAKEKYTADAIERARNDAFEWLEYRLDGYPRSWEQTAKNYALTGYEEDYDFEAPSIAGYEALEAEGLVTRIETVIVSGEERIHFRRTDKFIAPSPEVPT